MATLTNATSHMVDDGSASRSATRLRLIKNLDGSYTFAERGYSIGGSLIASGGGYVITAGDQSGAGIVARLSDGNVIIF